MYNYFQSKNELISELYLAIKTELFSSVIDVLDTSAPIKRQFIVAWLKFVDYAIANPMKYKFIEIFGHSPKISPAIQEEVYKMIYPLIEIYEKGKKDGIIKELDTMTLILFTTGAVSISVIRNSEMDEQEKAAIVSMAWDAIKS